MNSERGMSARARGLAAGVLLLGLLTMACRTTNARGRGPEPAAVASVLDAWHRAASEADGEGYFGRMTADSIFLGTDASERWSLDEFRAYAEPYFDQGRGWTYLSFDRHIIFAADGSTAWFDERLENEKYGELRGTGVLRLEPGGWRIAHYSMSFPIPNEVTTEVVDLVRAHLAGLGAQD